MLLRHLPLIAVAIAAMGAPAYSSERVCERTTVTYQECEPETRTWISGHYEWQCDDYVYVPGHWVIEPATCRTTRVVERESCHEPVVYAQPRCEEPRVVYSRPGCEPEPRCERETVVYTRPAPCREEPRHRRETVVIASDPCPRPSRAASVRIVPVPVPVPLPIPFPFPGLFRHHR